MGNIGNRYSGLGYMSYGTPGQVVQVGSPRFWQNTDSPSYGAPVITQPVSGATPPLTLGWEPMRQAFARFQPRPIPGQRVPRANSLRWILSSVVGRIRPGVAAQTPQIASIGVSPQQAGQNQVIGYTTPGANSNSPLFGRPGMQYTNAVPSWRYGPAPKLAPGTGRTHPGPRYARGLGFQPAGYGNVQYMNEGGLQQFDYTPATDSSYDIGLNSTQKFKTLPRSINVGVDGVTIVGTYRAHDFAPADRFFKQGRSASNWQDMSFGPNYRYLLPWQQVARYNLYNSIALARPLSPNNYFLGYQTQPAVASQLGGALGQGRPLGY